MSRRPKSASCPTPLFDPARPVIRAHVGGKVATAPTQPLRDVVDLALLDTPDVAQVSRAIAADPKLAAMYTSARNTVAGVSDGTAVLGLGDVGPRAEMPVMEGKRCCSSISAAWTRSRCASRPAASTSSSTRLPAWRRPTGASISRTSRHGAASRSSGGQGTARHPCLPRRPARHGHRRPGRAPQHGAGRGSRPRRARRGRLRRGGGRGRGVEDPAARRHVVFVDSQGVIHGTRGGLPAHKRELARLTNQRGITGGLTEALAGAHVFVGASGGTVPETALAGMAEDAIVVALANPHPEVHPDVAHRYAKVVATGRSDFPNQVNNVLAFPGILRGALDSGARRVTEEMKLAAAHAIAGLVAHLTAQEVVPSVFHPGVAPAAAAAVCRAD